MDSLKTNVYVDGFNLYYRSVRGSPYKWLGIKALVEYVFPQNTIHRIRYFTAKVSPTPDDPSKGQRQQVYIRALKTIPCLTAHFGRFLTHEVQRREVDPPRGSGKLVTVHNTEEKGSDVGLASYLVLDACQSDFEAAIVVSNDSDLVTPIRLVSENLGLPVGILNPQRNNRNVPRNLRKVASFYRPISVASLRASQFPETLLDRHGTIHEPDGW